RRISRGHTPTRTGHAGEPAMNRALKAIHGGCLALAAAALFSAPMPAPAQQQVDTSGRALDANPRVGSGGVNSLEGQIDYRLRNAVITGNVAGGRAFRGEVDYRAPGEFGGRLGSDDLFQFRTRSLPLDPQGPNAAVPFRDVTSGGAGSTSVYRDYTSLP